MINTKFKKIFPKEIPRQYQKEIIEKILEAFSKGKHHIVLSAPTGIGKSIIAMSIANWFNSAYILTSQKSLQKQYVKDFKIPEIKGKYNYQCIRNPKLKCDFGNCVKTRQLYKCKDCSYYCARTAAYKAPISVLNYTYWLNMCRASQTPQIPRKLLILDECHNAEQELIQFVTINLSKNALLKHKLGSSFLKFPKQMDSNHKKLDWLFNDVQPNFSKALKKEQEIFEQMDLDDPGFYTQSRKCSYLDTLECTMIRFSEELFNNIDVIIDQPTKDTIYFKLLFGKTFAKKFYWDWCNYSISMSATIFSKNQYCKELNLDPNDVCYIKCPSVFPNKNSPIRVLNIGSLSYNNKNKTKPKLLRSIEKILEKHKDERGIIHTINYEFAQYIYDNLNSADRLIFPKGKEREESINYFLHSDRKNLVLISPSLQEGIDLKDELSRFYIICKVPYASIGDPWVRARMNKDVGWYSINTVKNLVQISGRSIRSKDDYAIGYILDSDFSRFIAQNKKLFPKWWLKTLKK